MGYSYTIIEKLQPASGGRARIALNLPVHEDRGASMLTGALLVSSSSPANGRVPSLGNTNPVSHLVHTCIAAFQGSTPSISGSGSDSCIFSSEPEWYATAWAMATSVYVRTICFSPRLRAQYHDCCCRGSTYRLGWVE